MEGPISFWGYKEQESNLILPEHDDDDDEDEVQTALFKDPVLTALQTHFIWVIKTNQFML